MGINPISELKRHLDDADAPLSKRLCLARNVAKTQYLPTVAKERALVDWLHTLNPDVDVIRSILEWQVEDISSELHGKLIEVVAKYLENSSPEPDVTSSIIKFMENNKILPQLTLQIEDFMTITKSLLKHLKQLEIVPKVALCQQLFVIITQVYKAVTRKLDFVVKLLNGETLEFIFEYLNIPELRNASLNVCQSVLFPVAKKAHFVSFLQNLIRKESIDQLLEEKGDNIKVVMKIMSTFFMFPKGRTSGDVSFLQNFIDAFVSSYKSDSHLIFSFYIMMINSLNIQQTYINPAMSMPAIHFQEDHEKIKRNIFFKALECLKENDIDLNVRLTETIGEKLTKVEIKKNFTSFLQAAIINVVKLEGKPDKSSLKIITLALRLDPNLIEPKLDKILPNIMIAKKTNPAALEVYIEMINCLLDTLFKLSRGTEFISQMLPLWKPQLEAVNKEQFEIKQQLTDLNSEQSADKLKSKIIVGEDLFPKPCVERYGKLTSDLTLKQNGELFVTLQKEFETHCLILLSERYISPSLITLSEVLSAILSSVIWHSKMADHTVPLHITQEFWPNFQLFETELLSKYGECLLNLTYNEQLTMSFLQLCHNYGNLKLLNARYGNMKVASYSFDSTGDMFDFSLVLPCLNNAQWNTLARSVRDNLHEGCLEALNHLLLQKVLACDLLSTETNSTEVNKYKQKIKSHLIKEINQIWSILEKYPHYAKVLLNDLDANTEQDLSKSLVRMFQSDLNSTAILEREEISNNKSLFTNIVLETLKIILKEVEDETFLNSNKSIRKAIKAGFEFEEIVKGCDLPTLFDRLSNSSVLENEESVSSISNSLDILKLLKISCLDEKCQLLSIFIILTLKRIFSSSKSSKKIKKSIDYLLLDIFELSPKNPDLFKIFPIKFMFAFEDNLFLNLVTLTKIKVSNRSIVVKAILESAVKKVRTDSEVIKGIVKILLTNQKIKKSQDSSINYFSNDVFQTTCMILPIIAKEKKAITTSAYRSILADLQEKLHKSLLNTFKNIDFGLDKSLFLNRSENLEDTVTVEMSDSTLATLNALEAYSLTLSKYCESINEEDSLNLSCLLESLEYFVGNGVAAIGSADTKPQHVDTSVQLVNVVLRNVRKLAAHEIFREKDKLYVQIWQSLKSRLLMMFSRSDKKKIDNSLDDIAVTIKFLCELCSIDFFAAQLAMDLSNFMALKAPAAIMNSQNTPQSVLSSHQIARYLWSSILKANVVGPKSAALSKTMYRSTKNLTTWMRMHLDVNLPVDDEKMHIDDTNDDKHFDDDTQAVVKLEVDDVICDILKCDMDALTEAITNAKKITLSHRFLDGIFELHHSVHYILGAETNAFSAREASWPAFLSLADGALASLNSLLMHREELLEDRWPCYLQCYRGVVLCLCRRATSDLQLERTLEERLTETAHSLEKLTQAISKRRAQTSRLAAYLVADVCAWLERTAPARRVRQHLETAAALLMQASEGAHAAAFLRRALAGSPGHTTLTNLYTMYKRYHKYVGSS